MFLQWVRLPVALKPDQWCAELGVWSGSATVLPDGTPVISYTGNSNKSVQLQSLTLPRNLSDPLLVDWVKPSYNPVALPPAGVNGSQFRDPTTAWKGADGVWRMAVGARTVSQVDQVRVLKSVDFVRWNVTDEPLHTALGRKGMWEVRASDPRRRPFQQALFYSDPIRRPWAQSLCDFNSIRRPLWLATMCFRLKKAPPRTRHCVLWTERRQALGAKEAPLGAWHRKAQPAECCLGLVAPVFRLHVASW